MAIQQNGTIYYNDIMSYLNDKLSLSTGGTVNGNINANGFYVNSLRKLKENIAPTTVEAVNLINSQEIVDFNYINDPIKQHKVGLIADDSDSLFLNAEKEKVDLYNTCGILMKAIQELSAKVEFLEKQILEIKGE